MAERRTLLMMKDQEHPHPRNHLFEFIVTELAYEKDCGTNRKGHGLDANHFDSCPPTTLQSLAP